ncbi:YeaC family protein [Marinobacter zhejiangensis]|uniref:DUF1315 domain-containing protein n=1 Tax=Marinobacter zhejiangensis TaxID=488535 RepID=A0A1I4NH46_9GAMM|nr:DUF1315 family protein [Marinobacter zhejiangensis]SFM14705.1 hypothetical protein SAMN04487963_1389 [Marinobacter zhejiangensis]
MTYQELIERMDPSVYRSLRQAVELGKWPDGRVLSEEQRELCMEAVLYYESQHIPEDQRVGYIDRTKSDGSTCGPDDDASPIRIMN